MTELRKKFEALPEIEILLNRSNIFFSEDDMNYFTYNYDDQSLVDEHCIKLAWYAFQEQQKKIDAIIKWVEDNKKSIPLSEWHGYTAEEYVDADDLLELLK